jgi:hypothetical protein
VHFYPVGTELKLIGYEQGWFHVLEPATSRTGWIYEHHYLDAIPGRDQIQFAVHRPTEMALVATAPKSLTRKQEARPKQKFAKPKREQRMRVASARSEDDSVASIMESAFRRN